MNKFILSLLDTWDVQSLRLAILLIGQKEFFEINRVIQNLGLSMRFYRTLEDKEGTVTLSKSNWNEDRGELNLGKQFRVLFRDSEKNRDEVAFSEEDYLKLKKNGNNSISGKI